MCPWALLSVRIRICLKAPVCWSLMGKILVHSKVFAEQGMNPYPAAPMPPHIPLSALARPDNLNPFQNEMPSTSQDSRYLQRRPVHVPVPAPHQSPHQSAPPPGHQSQLMLEVQRNLLARPPRAKPIKPDTSILKFRPAWTPEEAAKPRVHACALCRRNKTKCIRPSVDDGDPRCMRCRNIPGATC
ncbi:hypothetical protein C8J56DRAFT_114890 [Mycena floridula]|nr:hypothetical protein C8J56DRAFT_114890 [Mycena floridula]